jgi:F-type H+-transporting ATPase subunit a
LNKLVKWVIFIALVMFSCYWMSNFASLGKFPTISLPAETVFKIGDLPVTSTVIATIIADIALILFALTATRKIRQGSPDADVPRGSQNIFELIIDLLYGLCKSVAGSKALKVFPLMATIFLFVLFANWMELLPGIESIGLLEQTHEGTGFKAVPVIPGLVYTVDQNQSKQVEAGQAEAPATESAATCETCIVVPFVRTATSDINTTLALALVTMAMVQVFGVRALGLTYFAKFINIPALKKGGMGIMFFVVGFLELISEIARILSFTFRLLGNIFAGGVLLLVMTSLIPFFLPMPFLGLELFVGFIQALVFSMLALVFVNMAMASHDEHAEAHH